MRTDGRRDALRQVAVNHPGLRLGAYWPDLDLRDDRKRDERDRWLAWFEGQGVQGAVEIYRPFFDARRRELQVRRGAEVWTLRTESRLAFGHGDASPSEIGMRLVHLFGMPMIPGTALKGVARRYLGDQGREDVAAEIFGQAGGADADFAARVTLHDAWWEPPARGAARDPSDGPFSLDTITVHHPDWYQRRVLPAEWDSPTPLAHLCATGRFLFAVESPNPGVAAFTRRLLCAALAERGVGGRTRKGYGRMLVPGQRAPAPQPALHAARGPAEAPVPAPRAGEARTSTTYDPGRGMFRLSLTVGTTTHKLQFPSTDDLFGGDRAAREAFVKACRKKGSVMALVRWKLEGTVPEVIRIERG